MMQPAMAPDDALRANLRGPPGPQAALVLEPVSHPELGAIRIDEALFAIGRSEAPFDTYPGEVVADLSRRHARIFCENGAVYLADLDSKNGTSVNGTAVRHAIVSLKDGDELGLGRTLRYRLQVREGSGAPHAAGRLAGLTLSPQETAPELQPVVITRFPFLISKADETFARYKDAFPQQVNYLSRRHAHIFLKGGRPYVEDLGSTNGTFIGNNRLDEHAVALRDGDLLGFGGHHFVYRVGLQWEQSAPDPTVTRYELPAAGAAPAADSDKTTFVAAADSFLDIFCVDQPPPEDARSDADASETNANAAETARSRGKFAAMMAELSTAIGVAEQPESGRTLRYGLAAAGVLIVLLLAMFHSGAPQREVRDLLADANYVQAAAVATAALDHDPDNAELKTLGTEALLKAYVKPWMAAVKARDYARASVIVEGLTRASRHNADMLPLAQELGWLAGMEKFVSARGGADAPVRNAADAARIRQLVKQWDDATEAHQRAFSTISSFVPEFRDSYAIALSHERKLALLGGQTENGPQKP